MKTARAAIGRQIIYVCVVFLKLGCSEHQHIQIDSGIDSSPDSATDDGDTGRQDSDHSEPTNMANVFEQNPVSTPEPINVELGWIAEDAEGTLTSHLGSDQVRLLKAFTCVDEEQTNIAPGIGEQRICSLKQLANKTINGSFEYTDYSSDKECTMDPENIHSEVNVYYHTQRIYELITDPLVGVFDRLPGRHIQSGQPVPLNLVANYRLPIPVGSGKQLAPSPIAFFLPHEYLKMGMATFQGLEGIEGDVLVFGQSKAYDFSYSAETIYHEFGHAVVYSTANLEQIGLDEMGQTNLPRALDEGIANTFSFIGTDDPILNEYLSMCTEGVDTGWFNAEEMYIFPLDMTGHPVADGFPVFGANWEIYRAIIDRWGGTKEDFIRIMLRTLLWLNGPGLSGNAFFLYAEGFLREMSFHDHLSDHIDETRVIFEIRGLFELNRSVEITEWNGENSQNIYVNGALDAPWNNVLNIAEPKEIDRGVTAYIQHTFDVPQDSNSARIRGSLNDPPWATGMMPFDDYNLILLLRTGESIHYETNNLGQTTITADRQITPTVTGEYATFLIDNLIPEESYSLHILNLGNSEALYKNIQVEFLNQ